MFPVLRTRYQSPPNFNICGGFRRKWFRRRLFWWSLTRKPWTKTFGEYRNSCSYIINGLANNDLEPIRDTHWRSEKFEDEKAYWTPAWKEWTDQWGGFVNSEITNW
jgi:hypothetical protein